MANNDNMDAARQPDTGNEAFELQYLQDMLGATREQIRAAIEAVGIDRTKIIAYLQSNKIPFNHKPR